MAERRAGQSKSDRAALVLAALLVTAAMATMAWLFEPWNELADSGVRIETVRVVGQVLAGTAALLLLTWLAGRLARLPAARLLVEIAAVALPAAEIAGILGPEAWNRALHESPVIFVLAASVGAAAGLFVLVATHEAGHLVGARLVRRPVSMIAIGPLLLLRRRDGWRAHFARRTGLGTGFVVLDQRRSTMSWRQALVTTIGGPAATLVTGVVGFFVARTALGSAPTHPLPSMALAAMGGVITVLAAFTLGADAIGRSSDAMAIRAAAQTRFPGGRAAIATRPRGFVPSDAPPDMWDASTTVHELLRAVDRQDRPRAIAARDRLLEVMDQTFPQVHGDVWHTIAFVTALVDPDPTTARGYLIRARRHGAPNAVLQAEAECAVLLREGKMEAARAVARHGLDVFGTDPRDAFWERDWLLELAKCAAGERSEFAWWFETTHVPQQHVGTA